MHMSMWVSYVSDYTHIWLVYVLMLMKICRVVNNGVKPPVFFLSLHLPCFKRRSLIIGDSPKWQGQLGSNPRDVLLSASPEPRCAPPSPFCIPIIHSFVPHCSAEDFKDIKNMRPKEARGLLDVLEV